MLSKDKQELAKRLHVSFERFNYLLSSANKAYEVIKELGPFYGREEIKEPTFRITAEPVMLPPGSKESLTQLGNDLLYLARALLKLPKSFKDALGKDLDFSVPVTWRIDAIINEYGNIQINEIEGQDGASALMMAEQLAYQLQPLSTSTAAKLITALKMRNKSREKPFRIAYIRVNNPHNANAHRFIGFIQELSKNTITVDHFFDTDIREGKIKQDWSDYVAIFSESSMSPKELYSLGITKKQLVTTGIYNAFVNKGLFALVFDQQLTTFWREALGKDRLERLQKILIPTHFITSQESLQKARTEGKVVKVSWATTQTSLINRSRGVAVPDSSVEQGSNERWQIIKELLADKVTLITQDYVHPQRIKAFLRKRGTTLEPVHWYNRVCVKYVCEKDPNSQEIPSVAMTAVEVTLGPEVIPAGRKCAFTAGKLA